MSIRTRFALRIERKTCNGNDRRRVLTVALSFAMPFLINYIDSDS